MYQPCPDTHGIAQGADYSDGPSAFRRMRLTIHLKHDHPEMFGSQLVYMLLVTVLILKSNFIIRDF